MTDLHTHVLFEIDDGAKDVHESQKMLEAMKKIGITTVVATPHFDMLFDSYRHFVETRMVRANVLSDIASNMGIKLMCGSEVRLSHSLLSLDSIQALCIEGTQNILVEMPFDKKWSTSCIEDLINLGDYFNVCPIIAHVERYAPVIKDIRTAERLCEAGAILQLDAESLFVGRYRRISRKLLKNGMISVIASDAHNTDARPPEVLAKAYDEIERLYGSGVVRELKSNADSLVAVCE